MKTRSSNFGSILCLGIAIYCLYLLLLDNILPLSIGSVLTSIGHWSKHWHILAIGLMPVYVGLMIFGTSLIGLYLGSNLQRVFTHFFRSKPRYSSHCKNDAIHLVRKSPSPIDSKVS